MLFDAKREALQLSRSVASLDGAICRIFREGWEWRAFEPEWYWNKRSVGKRETGLELYRRMIGDAIEARLPADLKVDVFRKGRRRGRTKCLKADCEKAHQKGLEKGFERGYEAAMREVELQKGKERKERPCFVQGDGRRKASKIKSNLMMGVDHSEGRYVLLDSPCSKPLTISFATQTLVRTTKSRRGTQVQ